MLDSELLIEWLREANEPDLESAVEGAFVLIPFIAIADMERRIRTLIDQRELHPFEEDELRARLAEQEMEIIYPDAEIAREFLHRIRTVYRASGEANLYCEWLRVLTAAIRRTGAEDVKVLTRSPYVARQLGEAALLLP